MAFKKWVVGKADKETAKYLSEECDIDPFSALLACSRGLSTPSELEQFISSEPLLCDPRELIDIEKAAECINTFIKQNKKIAIFGDYDCDGVVSTAVMYKYLVSRGADVITYIPDRISEGYGINVTAIDLMKSQGVDLIITVDNGISCFEEIKYAKKIGIETVICDHHIPPEVMPDAVAVVDPHRIDCPSSFKEVCGAVVAFKLVCVIDDKEPEELLYSFADLLAVATIGDICPLIDENRSIVSAGIHLLKKHPNVGISSLVNVAGIDRDSLSSSKISFGVVPRINAAGRMGDAARALKLLLCDDMREAIAIANMLDRDNAQRQKIEKEVTLEAIEIIERNEHQYNRVIVVEGEGWHSGIVGIVASRICEKYGKPTIVISVDDDSGHGSGRSYDSFNLFDAISYCSQHLNKYGGHSQAAGVSLDREKISCFRSAINEYANTLQPSFPKLNIDFRINPQGMSVDMVYAIKIFEPFGVGNAVPVFGIFEVRLDKIATIGSGKHLKLLFTKSGCAFQALYFGMTEDKFAFNVGDIVDLAVTLDVNYFRDEYTLSVQIKAIRLNGIDEEKLFSDIFEFDNYISCNKYAPDVLFPSRQEVGEIYKAICKMPSVEERILQRFLKTCGFAKTQTALKTLVELGLIYKENGVYGALSSTKTDLLNSATYKQLSERVKCSEGIPEKRL